MSRGGRLAPMLFAVAWLVAMPASAAAAAPNQLSNGWVSPGSGTTTTSFLFSVDYSSEKEFAATSVVALVAGGSVSLGLTSGTATGGTYSGSSALPAGTWAVTFEAQATQGPSASLAGPTVVVSAPAPAPAPPPPPPPPAPTAAPTPPPAAPAAVSTPAPVQPVSPTATPVPAEEPTDEEADLTPSTSPDARVRSPDPSATAEPEVAGSSKTDSSGAPRAQHTSGDEDSVLGLLTLVGALGALGALAVLARRRKGDSAPEAVAPVADGSERPATVGVAAISRRAAPTAHQVEDPILSAMGIGKRSVTETPIDAPLTRSVRSGPGERPETWRTRRARRR